MRPTLRQLQYIIAISDTGKFGDAAKSLNVSQSALSAQIADMEAFLGVRLIERGRHGAFLTSLGVFFVHRARDILKSVDELNMIARQGSNPLGGRIQLGVLHSIGPYLLPVAARRLHERYPELRLVVREERASELEEGLVSGRHDVVISTQPDHRRATGQALFREQLYICAAPDDPLSQDRSSVTLDRLKGRSLLSLGAGHRLGELIGRLAEEAGAVMSSEYEGTSLDAVRQMASMGAGIAVLPGLYALSEAQRDPAFIVRRIEYDMAWRDIMLCWRTSSPLDDAYRVLAIELSETAADILNRDVADS